MPKKNYKPKSKAKVVRKTKAKRKPKTKAKHKPKTKAMRKTKPKLRVQRGGIPSGGTSFDDLPNDLIGLVEYTVNSVVDFVDSTWYTLNIGSDLGTAFGPNEPNPNSVTIPGDVFD